VIDDGKSDEGGIDNVYGGHGTIVLGQREVGHNAFQELLRAER